MVQHAKNKNINVNESESESQMQMILESLLLGDKLTVLDGLDRFNCLALSQRISDLNRKHGWNIEGEYVKVKSGKRVMQYSLYKKFKDEDRSM